MFSLARSILNLALLYATILINLLTYHIAGRVLTDIVEQYHGKCQTLKYTVRT